jgi:hypothetical protein
MVGRIKSRQGRHRSPERARQTPAFRASVGDRITLTPNAPHARVRDGVIVEVQNGNGAPPYVVHWLDTQERALLYPGANTAIEPLRRSA